MNNVPLVEPTVLSSILILSTSICVRPASTVDVPPALIAVEPIVVALVVTAPELTAKFAVANDATPLFDTVASSPENVTVLPDSATSIPSPAAKIMSESSRLNVSLSAPATTFIVFASTYALTAFADGRVSSFVDTAVISASNTPDLRFATSMFVSELPVPSASKDLFVNVSVVALPTRVSVEAGRVTVTSAVDAAP